MRKSLSMFAVSLLLACSCSTTKFVPEGSYRLAENEVTVLNDKKFNTAEISAYIKQQPNSYFIFGWNPFLNVYNWGDGSEKGLDKVWRKIGTAPVVFNPSLVESSRQNIGKHLEYLGYYGSTISAQVTTVRRLAKVKYTIKLGKRYPIDEITFSIPDQPDFAARFKADSLNHLVKPGDYLSEKLLEEESVRGAAVFRGDGYYDFSKNNYFFVADTVTTPGRTVLDYQIKSYTRNEPATEKGPIARYKFGNVTITHADDVKFRESTLRKLNLIKPGDWYNENIVNNTYSRLSALKVFSGVSMQLSPTDSAVVDCNIRLSDSRLQGFKIDLEASTNSNTLIGISPQLSWYHKNIFHGGEWLTLGFTGNFQFKPGTNIKSTVLGASATLSFPKFLGLPYTVFPGPNIPRTEIKASFNFQDRPEFTRRMASASYGYTWQYGPHLFFQLYPLQMNFVNLRNVTDQFRKVLEANPYLWSAYSDHVDAGVGGIIYHTTDTDIVPKKPYSYERLAFDLSGNVVSLLNGVLPTNGSPTYQHIIFGVPYTQYVRAELQLGRTLRWGKGDSQALAMRFVAGAGHAYGNSTSIPYEKLFYVGGANSMRGWQAHALGPGFSKQDSSFAIPSQTGDLKFEADLEYRFKMFWKVEGALFAEAGNVWEMRLGLPDFAASIAGDCGLGLRVNLDFILVRLDAGFKVREPSRDPGSRWISPAGWFKSDGYAIHFGVGYPF